MDSFLQISFFLQNQNRKTHLKKTNQTHRYHHLSILNCFKTSFFSKNLAANQPSSDPKTPKGQISPRQKKPNRFVTMIGTHPSTQHCESLEQESRPRGRSKKFGRFQLNWKITKKLEDHLSQKLCSTFFSFTTFRF